MFANTRFAGVLVVLAITLSGCASNLPDLEAMLGGKVMGLVAADKSAYDKGTDYLRQGQLGLSLRWLRKALTEEPDSIKTLNAMGTAYDRLGRFDVARKYYRRGLVLDPKSVQTLNNLGYSYMLEGRLGFARKYLVQARTINKTDQTLAANLGVVESLVAAESQQIAKIAKKARGDDPVAKTPGGKKHAEPLVTMVPKTAWIERTSLRYQAVVIKPPKTAKALSKPVQMAKSPVTPAKKAPEAVKAPSKPVQTAKAPVTPAKAPEAVKAASAPVQVAKSPVTPAKAPEAVKAASAPVQVAKSPVTPAKGPKAVKASAKPVQVAKSPVTPAKAPEVVKAPSKPVQTAKAPEAATPSAMSFFKSAVAFVVAVFTPEDSSRLASQLAKVPVADTMERQLSSIVMTTIYAKPFAVLMPSDDEGAKEDTKVKQDAGKVVGASSLKWGVAVTGFSFDNIKLEISNGAGLRFMAARMSAYLRSRQVRVGWTSNERPFGKKKTVVTYRKGFRKEAEALAGLLPVKVGIGSEHSQKADVRLRLGTSLSEFDRKIISIVGENPDEARTARVTAAAS